MFFVFKAIFLVENTFAHSLTVKEYYFYNDIDTGTSFLPSSTTGSRPNGDIFSLQTKLYNQLLLIITRVTKDILYHCTWTGSRPTSWPNP
jgi:hypothetical protein